MECLECGTVQELSLAFAVNLPYSVIIPSLGREISLRVVESPALVRS